jgi:two-component system, OmpR family, sensor kinase
VRRRRGGDGHGRHHGRPRLRRLKTRLFLWFLGAIVMAIASSAAVVYLTRPEQTEGPVRVMSRNISGRLSRDWNDPKACDAYVAHLRDATGIELRIVRDPGVLPPQVVKRGRGGGAVAFTHDGRGYIPVARDGVLLGAVEFDSGMPSAPHLWRLGAALGVALFVLAMAAVRVSRQFARPLEQVASAAERFGAGDLTARAAVGDRPRRWVASEVAEVAGAFDRMAGRIEGIVRDQRELLAAISHELRSPLGRARVALEIARESASPEKPLGDVERQLGEIDAILGDLLASARAGLSDLRKEKTRLLPWLRARVASEPSPPVLEILAADDAEEIELSIDPALMARALHNVVANAKNHGHPDDAPLEVRVEVDGTAKVVLVVRDRGPGFAPDMLSRAFEPFVRADAARSPGGGTGLGLTLVSRIAQAHGGLAFARNVEGADGQPAGAEVGMELPLR